MNADNLIQTAVNAGINIGRKSAGHYYYTITRGPNEIEEYQFIGNWHEFSRVISALAKDHS